MKPICIFLVASMVATFTLNAQENKEIRKEKKEADIEKKEIIIEEKSKDGNEKMVIVIDGNNITINGKPAKDYKGQKHIVIDEDIEINGDNVRIPRKGRMYLKGFSQGNRAMLGVVTDKDDKGAKVKNVMKESAAEQAGIKEGDVITRVNEHDIHDQQDLVTTIENLKSNDEADITYLRDGKKKNTKAKLGKSNAPMGMEWDMDPQNFNYKFKIDPPVAMFGPRGHRPFLWNEEEDMRMFRNDRPKYGLRIEDNADGDGVKITGVKAESNAQKAGLKENVIITEAEGKIIKGTDDLKDVLGDARDKSTITLKVLRNGNAETISVKTPKVIKKAEL